MNKHLFIQLLHKYLTGKATKEEEHFVISYYNLFEHEPDVTALLTPERKKELKEQIQNNIWQNIHKQEASVGKVVPISKRPGLVAAAVVLVVFASVFFYFNTRNNKKPGSGETATGVAAVPGKQKENHFVRLPDGSTVVLSYGSKLDYPSSFDGSSTREVYLEGLAYFDIQHNAARPFIVHTGRLTITVLGTAFNIKAFSAEQDITVTVTRGKVKVSDADKTLGIITPAQQIVYNKQQANSLLNTVGDSGYLSWKEQDLLCDNVTMQEAAALLEERFNVKIIISDPSIRAKRFTTTFPRKESLEDALKSICEFNDVVFAYDKATSNVIINSK